MTHVKLLSSLFGIFLFIFALLGGFGALVSKILCLVVAGLVLLLVYLFIHQMTFGPHDTGNGFD